LVGAAQGTTKEYETKPERRGLLDRPTSGNVPSLNALQYTYKGNIELPGANMLSSYRSAEEQTRNYLPQQRCCLVALHSTTRTRSRLIKTSFLRSSSQLGLRHPTIRCLHPQKISVQVSSNPALFACTATQTGLNVSDTIT